MFYTTKETPCGLFCCIYAGISRAGIFLTFKPFWNIIIMYSYTYLLGKSLILYIKGAA